MIDLSSGLTEPRPPPHLLCFPSSDVVFATIVARAAGEPGDWSIRSLEEQLRPRYPDVRVRRRDLSGEIGETWYVYRDGRL